MWGIAVKPDLTVNNCKSILLGGRRVTLEEAVFRSEKAFRTKESVARLLIRG